MWSDPDDADEDLTDLLEPVDESAEAPSAASGAVDPARPLRLAFLGVAGGGLLAALALWWAAWPGHGPREGLAQADPAGVLAPACLSLALCAAVTALALGRTRTVVPPQGTTQTFRSSV